MVRISIEASERIGLACEAEAVAGPAVMSVPPQCRQRPLNAGQILAATVRYWPPAVACLDIAGELTLSTYTVEKLLNNGRVLRS
jgi:hypothetical protein